MPKSKDAFRTISEVADWLETPAHVLRFWESKFTQVKPVKRAGGRRYYRPADMQLLGGIKKLLHDDGLTIKGAQKLLREHGVKHVAALSQPLDDDLLEKDMIEEAAYEHVVQPQPIPEAPATVLSFPSRAVEPVENVAREDEPAPIAASAIEQPVEPEETQTPQEVAHTPDRSGDTPAFGSDALPAFLRRTPPPKTEAETSDEVTARSEVDQPAKLTINPTTHFEPANPQSDQFTNPELSEPKVETPVAPPPAAPIFSHRARAEMPTEAPQEQISAPSEPIVQETPMEQARVLVDVPAIAKIAPELDSYSAPSGVLAALPGTRQIAPELADQMTTHLMELRALRDRMQSH